MGKKCPHHSIDMKSTLPIEVISSVDGRGGGGGSIFGVL